jgi:hypothetical protein
VFLRTPTLLGAARQECPHAPLTTAGHQHTATRHSDFYVQNTASILASATWFTPNGPRILERLLPPLPCHAARGHSMSERAVLDVKIPAEGSHGACCRSPQICDCAHIPHAAQCRPLADTPGPPWAGGGQAGPFLPLGPSPIRSASSRQPRGAHISSDGTGARQHRVPHRRGRDNASGRTGGRRRRPRLGCHGQDMGNSRQGKPVTKEANGGSEAGRCRPCEADAPLCR